MIDTSATPLLNMIDPAMIDKKMLPIFEKMVLAVEGDHSAEQLMAAVKAGTGSLILKGNPLHGPKCYMLFGKETFLTRSVLVISGAVGDMNLAEDHPKMWPELAAAAKANGCSAVRLVGRRGFGRILRKVGWEEQHTVFERKL
tara:strand:- start:74 stop:502 length:429 start_codon:yes stop_codon:yes gene_type:complete